MTTQTPKLRFPEFSDSGNKSYKKHFFKDIFLFSTGKNIKQNEASPEFETPCVRYGELYHMYNEVIAEVINKTNLNKSELLFSDGDEILLPSAGEDPLDIGSASALTVANVAIGRTINVLKPQKANIYHQIFVAYYINQKLRKKISTLAKGSSISNVYNSDLKTLEIALPSFPEQTKIANFLTAIDEKIQALKQKKTLLEQYKKGIMQQIFSQQLRFKNDDGADFDDWEEKSLGEICEFYRGSPISKSDLAKDGEFQCIHYGELFTKYNEVINTVISKTNKEKGFLSQKGDILMPSSDVTPKGLAKASSIQIKNVVLGGDMNILRPNKSYSSIYLSYLLNFNTNKIIEIVSGTTVKHIYNKDVRNLEFVISNSLPEQQKIASFLTAIDEKIEKVSQQITATETYKKGLLQQMFI